MIPRSFAFADLTVKRFACLCLASIFSASWTSHAESSAIPQSFLADLKCRRSRLKIAPKNWTDFQHYKDRKPPWIRLHRALLDNQEFNALPPMAAKVLILFWLLASENVDGVIDDDPAKIAFRMRLPPTDVAEAMQCLLAFGFIEPVTAEHAQRDVSLAEQLREKSGFGSRHIPDRIKRSIWERDQGRCKSCSASQDIEYDHIKPISKGGESTEENLQLLCRACNRKKRVKTAEQLATPAQPELDRRTSETETETEKAAAPNPVGLATAGPIWGESLALLKAQGHSEKTARAFLGLLCRDYDETEVAAAVVAAAGKVDSMAYVRGVLAKRPRRGEQGRRLAT